MVCMTVVEHSAKGAERRAQRDLWLEDLDWHKRMYRSSRFRWGNHHVLQVLHRHTGGQSSFTTLEDLRLLQLYQAQVCDLSTRVRDALAGPLAQARDVVGPSWEPAADAVGLSVIECRMITWCAQVAPAPPHPGADLNVERVLHKLPFTNPLTQAWELKQLWRLYEAAVDVLEDTICDLVDELRPTRPASVLMEITNSLSEHGLQQRVDAARTRRGLPGDPRRRPRQVF